MSNHQKLSKPRGTTKGKKSAILRDWNISQVLFEEISSVLINLLIIFEIYRAPLCGYMQSFVP